MFGYFVWLYGAVLNLLAHLHLVGWCLITSCFVGYFKSLGGRVCFSLACFFFGFLLFLATYRMQSWIYSTRILDPQFLLVPHPQSDFLF